jgi:hypothetical protein
MAATGAVQGMLQPVTEGDNYWTQKIMQGGAGAVMAPVAKTLIGGVTPTAEAKLLKDAGATQLTPGQTYGGWTQKLENLAANTLFGGTVQKAQGKAQQQFIQSQLDSVLAPLDKFGVEAPSKLGLTGMDAVKHVGRQVSDVYDQVVPHAVFQLDQPTVTGMQDAVRRATSGLKPSEQKELVAAFKSEVTDRIMGIGQGRLTGSHLKDLESTMKLVLDKYSGDTTAYGKSVREAFRDSLAIVHQNLEKNSGSDVSAALKKANLAWARYNNFLDAAKKAVPSNEFTPAQMGQAIRSRAAKGRYTEDPKVWGAAKDMKVTPNWESAQALNFATLGNVGAGLGAMWSPSTAALTLAAPLAYASPTAIRATNAILGARPQALRELGPIIAPLSAAGASSAGTPRRKIIETEQ